MIILPFLQFFVFNSYVTWFFWVALVAGWLYMLIRRFL